MLGGEDVVVVVGYYMAGIITYKMLDEIRTLGEPLDVGWVTSRKLMNATEQQAFIDDYHTDAFPVVEGSFTSFFTSENLIRKGTNITEPRFIVATGYNNVSVNGSLLFDKNNIRIYKVE